MRDGLPKLKKPSPIELQVIRASDFICFDADEHLNFEESKKVLQQLALACRKRGMGRAMVDLRDLPVPEKPRFTEAQLVGLVDAFRDAGFAHRQRLAILHSHDVHGTIRDFISIGRQRGLHTRAFLEYDKAMHWLAKATEPSAEHKQGAEVPIKKARSKAKGTGKATAAKKRKRATKPAAHSHLPLHPHSGDGHRDGATTPPH
ncbi:MAG TPA: hypothetical protein VMF08_06700 [Candidatus Sulfotelmatobacter sp.]|nr:hypothetical protein [Candidatus Sulfotelmatobacter sp.]